MKDRNKTKEQLIKELTDLRRAFSDLHKPTDRATLAFIESIIDSIAEPITVLNDKFEITWMNRAAREFLLGAASPVRPFLCYKCHHRKRFPCDGVEYTCPMQKGRVSREPLTVVHEHFRSDGQKRLLEIVSTPLWSKEGTFQGIIEVARDITEQREASEKITFLASIMQTIPDAVCSIDMDGTIRVWNEGAEEMFGYKAEELLGKHITTVVSQGEIDHCLMVTRTKGSFTGYESVRMAKDGRIVQVEVTGVAIKDRNQNVLGYASITRDITKRKRYEEEIGRLQRHHELILNSVGEGIVGLDASGNHTFVNPAAAKMLGYEVKELLGKHSHTLWHHTKADGSLYQEEECPIYEVYKDGVMRYMSEERFWRKDGTAFPVECTSTPIIEDGRLIGAVVTFRDVTEHKKADERIRSQLQRLAALRDIDRAITSSLDVRVTLKVVLEEVTRQLHVSAAEVLLFKPYTKRLEYAAGLGFRTAALKHTSLMMGKGYAGVAALEQRIINIPELSKDAGDLARAPLLRAEGFVSYFAAPLIAKGQVKGVLEIFHRSSLEPDREWLDFLESLAVQAAIAIDNAELFNELQRANIDLTLAYDATIEGWSSALDMRDKETEGHSQRVTEMTIRMAEAMGIRDAELVHVRRGALLHDIGKMGIPDNILLKEGKLTEEEREIMHKHPVFAYRMLSAIAFLRPALDIPYCHHEKWDGTGYPRRLKGEQIPLAARIFAVVDVWDALCSDRSYRPAWTKEKAREYLKQEAGAHFDPKVVEVFLKMETE